MPRWPVEFDLLLLPKSEEPVRPTGFSFIPVVIAAAPVRFPRDPGPRAKHHSDERRSGLSGHVE